MEHISQIEGSIIRPVAVSKHDTSWLSWVNNFNNRRAEWHTPTVCWIFCLFGYSLLPWYMADNGKRLRNAGPRALPIGGHVSGHKPPNGGLNCGSIMPNLFQWWFEWEHTFRMQVSQWWHGQVGSISLIILSPAHIFKVLLFWWHITNLFISLWISYTQYVAWFFFIHLSITGRYYLSECIKLFFSWQILARIAGYISLLALSNTLYIHVRVPFCGNTCGIDRHRPQ